MKYKLSSLVIVAAMAAGPVWGHGDKPAEGARTSAPSHEEERSFGRPGDAKKATRTITVKMSDAMRFAPADISVRRGETVKFVVRNEGKVLHEMVLGTMADLKKHHELMKKFPNMEHDEPSQVHVRQGKTGEMVWQFSKVGDFHFACLIPGHFEAGMIGRIKVVAR